MQIYIALSGGIDSLVAAYLLKEQGHDIIGIHFLTGYETRSPHQIEAIGEQLDIPVYIIDCRAEFQTKVVDYFIQTYQCGKTPNPCLICNPAIKFGTLLGFAREHGASCLATGHYAQIREATFTSHFSLLKGADSQKDQSYFLAFLTQKQLAHACFPLGSMTKAQVIALATEKKLHPVAKKESQDICFIRGKTYGDFLAEQRGFKPEPGLIENINGNIIGEHKGLHLFTVGQRRGINCPAAEPYYVVRMDIKRNRLIVGFKNSLFTSVCRVTHINWIHQMPTSPIKVHTRVRYRHNAVPSTVFPLDTHIATVKFEIPQLAITPGQGAVFYQEDEVLGGGWIEE